MTWTLQHAATTQSLEAWGLEAVTVTERSFAPGTLQMQHVANFDAAALFDYGDRVTLRGPDDLIRFTGLIRQRPARIGDKDESRVYVAEDVLGDLARRTMTQSWRVWDPGGEALVEVPQAALVLFSSLDAEPVTISAQLTAVITAAAAAGIAVQMGTSAGMTANPQAVEARPMTYLEALRLCAKFAPDLCTQVDHTTTPPTLNFVRRVNATERSLAILNTSDEFTCDALDDQRVSGVHISYRREVNVAGLNLFETVTDKHPAETTGDEENALVVVHELRGASPPANVTQTQEIETVEIDEEDFDWWQELWPELADRNEAATLTETALTGPSGVNNQIISGAHPAWVGSAATVLVEATFNGVINGVVYVGKKLIARVNASSLATGTYEKIQSPTQYDPGETPPTGIAALLYASLNPLQFVGAHTRVDAELDWTIRVGDALNFTGTADAALTTARASVQTITRRIDDAVQTIEFGPASAYSFNDLIDLLRGQRVDSSARAQERAGEGAGSNVAVEGAGMGPGAMLVPTHDPTATHIFKVAHVGGNNFRVEAGQIDGYTLPAATLDVGATRPVRIIIAAKYVLGVYDGEHVYSVALNVSEDNEPVLYAATSPADDVGSIHDGDEARVIIALIEAGEIISQFANKNITSTWINDGTLTGTINATFDKS